MSIYQYQMESILRANQIANQFTLLGKSIFLLTGKSSISMQCFDNDCYYPQLPVFNYINVKLVFLITWCRQGFIVVSTLSQRFHNERSTSQTRIEDKIKVINIMMQSRAVLRFQVLSETNKTTIF